MEELQVSVIQRVSNLNELTIKEGYARWYERYAKNEKEKLKYQEKDYGFRVILQLLGNIEKSKK